MNSTWVDAAIFFTTATLLWKRRARLTDVFIKAAVRNSDFSASLNGIKIQNKEQGCLRDAIPAAKHLFALLPHLPFFHDNIFFLPFQRLFKAKGMFVFLTGGM